MGAVKPGRFLVCRAGALLCALPVDSVVETLRPLPVETVPGTHGFVAGMAIVRGEALAVVALARLLGEDDEAFGRFVVISTGGRRVALAVGAVIGMRPLSAHALANLPPLLGSASRDAVGAIGTLDGELLLVLEASRVVADETVALALEAAT